MAETVNQETAVTAGAPEAAEAQARTFTQAEMDAIIGDRLARERAKYSDYESLKARAAELENRENALKEAQKTATELRQQVESLQKNIDIRNAREKVASETGVPAGLLTGETEEDCRTQAEALRNWRGQQPNYPETSDGGEARGIAGGKTRDQFASWFSAAIK